MSKRVIVQPQKDAGESLDELLAQHAPQEDEHKKAEAYLISNFTPQINYAIRQLRNSGHIPHDVSNSDLHEAAVHGLMKAIHGYDPATGKKLSSYAIATISGAIKEHLKPKDVPQSLLSQLPVAEKKPGQQYMHVASSSTGRQVAETMGGSMGEEGAGTEGYSTIASSAAQLAQRLTPEQRTRWEAQLKEHDAAKAKVGAPAPVPTPKSTEPEKPLDTQPTANLGEAKEVSPGKKIMVRRAIDHSAQAGEDTKLRHLAVDQAKNGGKA